MNATTSRVISGFHAVVSRIRQDASAVSELYIDSSRGDRRMKDLEALAAQHRIRILRVDHVRLDGLTGQARHQGVAAKVSMKALPTDIDEVLENLDEPPLLLILDGVTDPHNLGACLRVADAMGVHAVIAPKDRAAGLNATVSKVASGAAESVPYISVTNLARTMRDLKQRGVWLMGASERGEADLFEAKLEGPIAWVMGAEGEGMRRLTTEECDELIRVPMMGVVESLNVSVTAGICLSETRRQRRVATKGK